MVENASTTRAEGKTCFSLSSFELASLSVLHSSTTIPSSRMASSALFTSSSSLCTSLSCSSSHLAAFSAASASCFVLGISSDSFSLILPASSSCRSAYHSREARIQTRRQHATPHSSALTAAKKQTITRQQQAGRRLRSGDHRGCNSTFFLDSDNSRTDLLYLGSLLAVARLVHRARPHLGRDQVVERHFEVLVRLLQQPRHQVLPVEHRIRQHLHRQDALDFDLRVSHR
eukprot:1865501-Rhodomonas_salina.2